MKLKYKELYKFYYNDRKLYEEVYHSRYENEVSVHLDFQIENFPCFFLPSMEMMQYISKIYKVTRELQKMENILPGIAKNQFKISTLVEEIQLSNEIEGVRSTRKEIRDTIQILKKNDSNKRIWGLVNKYLMLSRDETLSIQTCADIRKIYDDLLEEEIKADDEKNLPDGAIFRKEIVHVQNEYMKNIHDGLYPEERIITAMEKALNILNDKEIEPLIKVCIFHYLFGYIHPFYDGNGRTSRFLSSYILSKELDSLVSYNLSTTIKKYSSIYYKSFDQTNKDINRGDLTGFILQFLNIILEAVKDLLNNLQEKNEQLKFYENILDEIKDTLDDKSRKIIYVLVQNALFSSGYVAVTELVDITHFSKATIYDRLKRLDAYIVHDTEGYSIDLAKLDKKGIIL